MGGPSEPDGVMTDTAENENILIHHGIGPNRLINVIIMYMTIQIIFGRNIVLRLKK